MQSATVEQKWTMLNDYCIATLLNFGAKWDQGPQTRGKPPQFVSKTVCPGQIPSGAVKTHKLHYAYKAFNRFAELERRLCRITSFPQDWHVTRVTLKKAKRDVEKLHIPSDWTHNVTPTLVDIYNCKTWLWNHITEIENTIRTQRISKWKEKIQCSATGTFSYVYEHLKNKALEEPANLVTTEDGQIVFQPQVALEIINDQWDEVFSANVMHNDPMCVIEIAWPYIKNAHVDYVLPDLSADDLHELIQNRKAFAAPGLDGWRTAELQRLPKVCFEPIANFFRNMEDCDCDLPRTFTCAKQMILNKNGKCEPLNKRLITVLPALLLTYTGARYKHLQGWQQECMPKQIVGGIKNRQMAHIATDLRLQIDKAELDGTALIGIKLDKSKCFDRIVPTQIAAMFLSFGMDKKLVNFFLKIYKGLHRHLFYKGWACDRSTTTANGVAQGCSLSLVAINLLSNIWVRMIQCLPEITARAFVDDAYLWTHIANAHILQDAFAATELWDTIVGQKLNAAKSVVWATSQEARKIAKSKFPQMTMKLEIDVLGSLIYTSHRNAYVFSDEKLAKIITDTRNIAALPLSRKDKTKILGAKVIPQCTYATSLANMPKTSIGKIQTEIVHVLWQRRPPWRARWLVLTFLGKPYRTEPHIARAYNAIMEFLRFFHANMQHKTLILELLNAPFVNKYGLIPKLRNACDCFGINVHDDLTFSWRNSHKIPAEELAPKDIRNTLQMLAVNATYYRSTDAKRKDLFKPTGILDFDLTTLYQRNTKLQTNAPFPPQSLFENQLVGAAPTRDRLFAANLHETSRCRFCSFEKESMLHFLECNVLKEKIGSVPEHELGPNFTLLGIVEHPNKIAEHRLRFMQIDQTIHHEFDPTADRINLWTDGSVMWNDVHWLAAGGYSIVNEEGRVLRCGPVMHWQLTSYTTELFALVTAVCSHQVPLLVNMDCQTIVRQFHVLLQTMQVDTHWSHPRWWEILLHHVKERRTKMDHPLILRWIPAHVLENIPEHLITAEMAKAHKTTCKDIALNRIADKKAKEIAEANCAVDPRDKQLLTAAIDAKQTWLTRLADLIYCDVQELQRTAKESTPQEDQTEKRLSELECREKFPDLYWNMDCRLFEWKADFPTTYSAPRSASFETDAWEVFKTFCHELCWKEDENLAISFVELTLIFHLRGFNLPGKDAATTTFRDLYSVLRKMFCTMKNSEDYNFFPGQWCRCKNRNYGKSLPAGYVAGASPWLSNHELTVFANLLHCGGGKNLSTWTWFLDDERFMSWGLLLIWNSQELLDRKDRNRSLSCLTQSMPWQKGNKASTLTSSQVPQIKVPLLKVQVPQGSRYRFQKSPTPCFSSNSFNHLTLTLLP